MSLKDQMTADLSMLFAEGDGAKEVVYRLPDGTQTTCTANVWDMVNETRDVRGIQTIVATRSVTFRFADIGNVNLRASVIIDGEEWAVSRVNYADDYQVTVEIQRHDLHAHARPGYRRTS